MGLDAEKKIESLLNEVSILKTQLMDSVNQNLKLLSLLDITRISNSIFSLEQSLKELIYLLQENLSELNFSLVYFKGEEWNVLFQKEGNIRHRFYSGKLDIPQEYINSQQGTFGAPEKGSDSRLNFLAPYMESFFEAEVERERVQAYPLFVTGENVLLGFLLLNGSSEALPPDTAKFVEVCQKQLCHILNTHYYYEVSNVDALTGLFNRRYCDSKLGYEIKRCRRKSGSLSIMLCDLDKFKVVNDTYGHLAGDLVLVEFAKIVLDSIREIDIACRMGGEEFLVILPDTNIFKAGIIARRIRERLQDHVFNVDGKTFSVTVSAGISSYDRTKDPDSPSMVDRTDQALYKAKETGRNKVIAAN